MTKLPSLDRLFYPGMLLPCKVIGIQGTQVSVSIDPAVVNADITASSIKQGMVRWWQVALQHKSLHFCFTGFKCLDTECRGPWLHCIIWAVKK